MNGQYKHLNFIPTITGVVKRPDSALGRRENRYQPARSRYAILRRWILSRGSIRGAPGREVLRRCRHLGAQLSFSRQRKDIGWSSDGCSAHHVSLSAICAVYLLCCTQGTQLQRLYHHSVTTIAEIQKLSSLSPQSSVATGSGVGPTGP